MLQILSLIAEKLTGKHFVAYFSFKEIFEDAFEVREKNAQPSKVICLLR